MHRLALAAIALGLTAGPAAARTSDQPPPPPPTAQQQAAIDACKAQGFARGSDAFNQCIAKLLGGPGQPPGPAPTQGPPPSQPGPPPTPSFKACQAQGLKVGSDAFNACVKAADAAKGQKPNQYAPGQQAAVAACKAKGLAENTPSFQSCLKAGSPTGPAPSAADQAALDGCKASGLAERTDAFKACVAAAAAAASVAGWNGEQLAAFNSCKAAGIAFPSAAFAACLSKVLTKLLPDKGTAAQKDVQATVLACQAKKLLGAALQQCVRDGLKS
ncbi:MAG: hypothetical protein ABUS54_05540 [Actinomycetota bacterium]